MCKIRKLACLAVLIIAGIAFTGCSKKEDPSQEPQYRTEAERSNKKDKSDKPGLAGNMDLLKDDKDSENKENSNEDWKNAYIPIVQNWNNEHSGDFSYGYNLIYLDDNDVPELVLMCDDEAWHAMDMYTCKNGEASRILIQSEDGNIQSEDRFLSPGHQGMGNSYFERSGIYLNYGGMMGTLYIEGFILKDNLLTKIFYYTFINVDWDEENPDPYRYEIGYIDKDGDNIFFEKKTDDDTKFYEINNVPEASEIEDLYNFSFLDESEINAPMTYNEICDSLGCEDSNPDAGDTVGGSSHGLEAGLSYAELLRHYLHDSSYENGSYLLDGVGDGIAYESGDEWYFALKDLNGDNEDELLITHFLDENGNTEATTIFIKESDTLNNLGSCYAFYDENKQIIDRVYSPENSYDFSDVFYTFDGNDLVPIIHFERSSDGNDSLIDIYTYESDHSNSKYEKTVSVDEARSLRPPYLKADWLIMNEENISTALENKERRIVVSTTDGGANLRKGPGTQYEIVFNMIPDGTVLNVIGTRKSDTGKDWALITYEGQKCWVALSQTK